MRFSAKPLGEETGTHQVWVENLHRDLSAEQDLLGKVDRPHGAPADLLEDPVFSKSNPLEVSRNRQGQGGCLVGRFEKLTRVGPEGDQSLRFLEQLQIVAAFPP